MTRLAAAWTLALLWLFWMIPVVRIQRFSAKALPERTASASLIWMIVQAAAYPVASLGSHAYVSTGRLVLAIPFGLAGLRFMWTAVPALGKQWRLAAGVNHDHELVQTGSYALVRHPIYTSMLAMLLATGLTLAPWRHLTLALILFGIGTGGRIRMEEKILIERFGAEFERYRARVPALVPWPKRQK